MPIKKEKMKPIMLKLYPSLLDEIDFISSIKNANRSALIRDSIEFFLDYINTHEINTYKKLQEKRMIL